MEQGVYTLDLSKSGLNLPGVKISLKILKLKHLLQLLDKQKVHILDQ